MKQDCFLRKNNYGNRPHADRLANRLISVLYIHTQISTYILFYICFNAYSTHLVIFYVLQKPAVVTDHGDKQACRPSGPYPLLHPVIHTAANHQHPYQDVAGAPPRHHPVYQVRCHHPLHCNVKPKGSNCLLE